MRFLKTDSQNLQNTGEIKRFFDKEKSRWEIKKKQIALNKKKIEILLRSYKRPASKEGELVRINIPRGVSNEEKKFEAN